MNDNCSRAETKNNIHDNIQTMIFEEEITVSAWISSREPSAEKMQALVSKWQLSELQNSFDAYDASFTDGLDTGGFLGAIFDGRYVYFSPQHNSEKRHGNVLRYDTYGNFNAASSWNAFNAESTSGLSMKGFYGGLFDGRYVYFTPRNDGIEYHTRILRYDTQGEFKSNSSWDAFETGLGTSYQGAGFDGRYAYFAPGTANKTGQSGVMLRYDTHAIFTDKKSWNIFNIENLFPGLTVKDFDGVVFDGKYIYFVPLKFSVPVRYDTTLDFSNAEAWQAFDAKEIGMSMCVGAIFDGKYIYYAAYDNNIIVSYDIAKSFESKSSWKSFDVKKITGNKSYGYDGAFFDGKNIYFIPFFFTDSTRKLNFHGQLLIYDTTLKFDDSSSWKIVDMSNISGMKTVGYNAGIFDGRYFYFAPWHDGEAYTKDKIVGHGRVVRYDAGGNNCTFILKYSDLGHNGGLSGAVPGPAFTVNTDKGPRTISANRIIVPGEYKITGVYDGMKISLYINDELVNERLANGKIINCDADIIKGNIENANASFNGTIKKLEVKNKALFPEKQK